MAEEIKGTALNDLANAFIWSAFKYYLRQPTDSYIVFSPVKYWKSQHLITKRFMDGFAFNRKHFHTNIAACIMVALWSNEDDTETTSINLKAFDIQNGELKREKDLKVDKIYTTFSKKYYDKRKIETATEDGILVGLNGLEASSDVKKRIKPLRDEKIIGYLVADGSGFDNPDTKSSLLVAGRYNGNGFFLKKDNFIEKLPMFAASRYVRYNSYWTERSRIMKSGDGFVEYLQDIKSGKIKQELLKILLFCIFEAQNHMRSFTGTNGIFYRNELCLDITNGETLASEALKTLDKGHKEIELLDLWDKIIKESKKNKNYDKSLTYGIYQIVDELNTVHKDELDNNVFDYPVLNGDLVTLRNLLKSYYIEEIVPFLFKYEFLK